MNFSFCNSFTCLTVHHQGDCQCQLHEEEEAKDLIQEQRNKADKEIKEIEAKKGGRVGKIWEVRKD